jgi:hypothetical protein
MKKILTRLIAAAWLAMAVAGAAHASTNTATVDIKVSIQASKSLSVATTSYDFGALTVNTSSVSASALVVTNDSGALIETYSIQGADAVSTGGGTAWELDAAAGTDQFALAAQFSSARPSNADGSWGSDNLTEDAATTCDANTFGNGTPGESGAVVSPLAGQRDRNLWFRLKTPTAVSDTTQHKIVITVAVQ